MSYQSEYEKEQREARAAADGVRKRLLELGYKRVRIEYSGGNDEGGGHLAHGSENGISTEHHKLLSEEFDWILVHYFVDQHVDQLGYGSWAGEFEAWGHFDVDLTTNSIVPGSHQGTESSPSYSDVSKF